MKRGRKKGWHQSFKVRVKKKILKNIDKKEVMERFDINEKHSNEFSKFIDELIKESVVKTEELISNYHKADTFDIFEDQNFEQDGEYYNVEDFEEEREWL